MYIGNVNAVFLEISPPFPFIPSESHEFIIHIIMRVTRRFSFQGFRNMRPVIPEWDVNSVFVHKVADVREWDGVVFAQMCAITGRVGISRAGTPVATMIRNIAHTDKSPQ
jgi:hypothetical protein